MCMSIGTICFQSYGMNNSKCMSTLNQCGAEPFFSRSVAEDFRKEAIMENNANVYIIEKFFLTI